MNIPSNPYGTNEPVDQAAAELYAEAETADPPRISPPGSPTQPYCLDAILEDDDPEECEPPQPLETILVPRDLAVQIVGFDAGKEQRMRPHGRTARITHRSLHDHIGGSH